MKRMFGLVLAVLAASLNAQVQLAEITPPAGFSTVSLERVSQDGNRVYFLASNNSASTNKGFVWVRGVGVSALPTALPDGSPISALRFSNDGTIVYGSLVQGVGHFYWNLATNDVEKLEASNFSLSDVSFDGDQALLRLRPSGPVGTAPESVVRWIGFNSIGTELQFPVGTITGRLLGNHFLNNYFLEVGSMISVPISGTSVSESRFLSAVRLYNSAGASLTSQTTPFFARLLGVAKNAPVALMMRMDSQANQTSLVLHRYGGATLTMPSTIAIYGQKWGEHLAEDVVADNGKLFVGKSKFYREDLGLSNWSDYFLQYFSQADYMSQLGDVRFCSVSGNAKTLVGNGGPIVSETLEDRGFARILVVLHNPDTFHKKLGERYSISVKIKTPAQSLLTLDPDDKTPRTLEVFYSLTSSLLNPSSQSLTTLNAVTMGNSQTHSLVDNSNFVWNTGTSENFSISGSVSDYDAGGTNDTLLSGPFNLTLTDLKNGGKTFSGVSASVVVTSTYLGPVLDPNS